MSVSVNPTNAKFRTLLVDNGSLAPAATRQLRRVAEELGRVIGTPVAPVSLQHSDAIDAAQLGGVPAEILERALEVGLARGQHEYVAVPLFFGPSRALTHFLPERVAHLQRRYPGLRVRVAAPLFESNDQRLAEILTERIRSVSPSPMRIVVVDHGSPVKEVAAVRDALAAQVREYFSAGTLVAAASMERRAGDEYAFNEPLLEHLLGQPGWNSGDVVVALQFLVAGRHAGAGGDIERICQRAESRHPGLRIHLTTPMADHPLVISILADRWRSVLRIV